MSAAVRAARPDEAEAVLEVLCLAFGLSVDAARPIFYGDPYYELSHKRVLSPPGCGVVSCLTVVPASVRVGGVPVPAAGIAGVATRPAFQRRGHAGALLAATVPALWEELGFPVALLHPVSAPFYRRFGWEYASRQVRWLSSPVSPTQPARCAPVRPAGDADWPAIQTLHADLTRLDTGACARDARRWSLIQLPIPGREAFVCEEADGLSGYLLWEQREALQVLEMHGRTPNARRGLLGWLARQPDPLLEWITSPALLVRFGLSGLGLAPEPGVMLRIVDLEAALLALHPVHYAPTLASLGATLTVHAGDTLRPENNRPLRLTPDGVSTGTNAGGPWMRADIRILARLFFGDLSPSEAASGGALFVDTPQTLPLADRLFPQRGPYVAPLDQF